jgi:hypothetical protein
MKGLNYLNNPYPFETSWRIRLKTALFFGVFVFLFLLTFRPFGLTTFPGNILLFTAGYGLVTLVAYLFIGILVPYVCSSFYDFSTWNVWKEVLSVLLSVLLIGILNVVYSCLVLDVGFSAQLFLFFLFYTVAVGIIPIVVLVFVKEFRLRAAFEKGSREMNEQLTKEHQNPSTSTAPTFLTVEDVEIPCLNLMFLQASANYVELVFGENGKIDRKVIRATLKEMELALQDSSHFFRCHKSFIVNLEHVSRISGNAQGYKLHLKFTEEVIPVSRAYNDFLKSYFDKQH